MAEDVVVLQQEGVSGHDLRIELVDGKELHVERKGNRSRQEYRVNILVLADKSKLQIRFAWPWFAVAIIIILLHLPGSPVSRIDSSFTLGMLQFISIIAIPVCLYMTWKKTVLRQIFYSRSAHFPLIRFAPNKPSKQVVDAFIRQVEERIQSYRKFMNLTANDQLAGEMRTLRRLRDEGIVGKRAYNNVKARLFKQF